jgi:glycosyltransferase involved in cell wall biosynthesis
MQINSPVVSVIIPTYNRKDKLRICLNSLHQQTYKNFEVLVCDDGSTDNTIEVINEFKNLLAINYIKDANFGGPAMPRNNGIQLAKGEVIAFLDSDDWWYPTKLEISLPFLAENDLVYHDLDVFNSQNKKKSIAKGRVLTENITKDLIINGNGIINSSVLVRKSIIELVGKITDDKNLIAVEDYDYWIRISQLSKRFKYINISLGAYREDENISYDIKQVERLKYILDKYLYVLNRDENKLATLNYYFCAARIYHYFSFFDYAKKLYLKSFTNRDFKRKIKSAVGYLMCCLKINDHF